VNDLALEVARRFEGRRTEQAERLHALLQSLLDPLAKAERLVPWRDDPGPPPEKGDPFAKRLSDVSKEVLKGLKVTFEDTRKQEKAKHFLTRLKNLVKMITEWANAPTWAELEPVLKSQRTKSKYVRDKYVEYAQEIEGLVDYFDTEHEGTLTVGPWNVSLFTSSRADWDDEVIGKLKHVLEETTKVLSSMGVGGAAGGTVFAYPTETLPGAAGSHSAYASYRMSQDMMFVSAQGAVDHVLHSLVHESGHRVYFRIMTANARDEWKAFFEAESGPPDVDSIIKAWEAYAAKPDWEAQKYGKYTAYFGSELSRSDPDMFMWFKMIVDKLPEQDKLDPMTGAPKKGTKTGLDILIENRSKIRTFLHPVTTYSGKDADEAFAEVFAIWGLHGPGRVPEIVREMFKKVLPRLRSASDAVRVLSRYWVRHVAGDVEQVWVVKDWDNRTEYLRDCVWPVAASDVVTLVNGTSLMRRGNPKMFKTEAAAMRDFERRMKPVDAMMLRQGLYRHMHSDARIIYVSVPDKGQ
jgi:hypothetical protein